MKKVIIIITILTINSLVFADLCREPNKFFYDNGRGWFYGEYCEPKKPKKQKEQPQVQVQAKRDNNTAIKDMMKNLDIITDKKPTKTDELKFLTEKEVKIPWDIIDKLDPDSVSKIETDARKIAISNPTYDNVREYMKLQKYITDKSTKYMEMFQLVSQTDPVIAAWGGSIESSKFARQTKFIALDNDQKRLLVKYAKEKAGLVMFYKEGCPYCAQEKNIFDMLHDDYGFEYEMISINQQPGMAQKFQVTVVPDMFIVFKGNNGQPIWRRIGIGLHTEPEMVEIIYSAIQQYEQGGGFINGRGNL
jgi:conjugal transfer pilus assembly protein TraF